MFKDELKDVFPDEVLKLVDTSLGVSPHSCDRVMFSVSPKFIVMSRFTDLLAPLSIVNELVSAVSEKLKTVIFLLGEKPPGFPAWSQARTRQ